MAYTEGEKELVLGNKQLISLFFVVVALCGVFFALGYMMGRPPGKPLAATSETAPAAAPAAAVAQPQESEPPRETAQAETSPAPADAETQAASSSSSPSSQSLPSSPQPATETHTAQDVQPPVVPEAGATYLQVTALRRTDADNLVKTLREQNLPALLADSSKPDLFRVLVGPYHQTADVADAKAKLKALGFANAFVQK